MDVKAVLVLGWHIEMACIININDDECVILTVMFHLNFLKAEIKAFVVIIYADLL